MRLLVLLKTLLKVEELVLEEECFALVVPGRTAVVVAVVAEQVVFCCCFSNSIFFCSAYFELMLISLTDVGMKLIRCCFDRLLVLLVGEA